MKVLVLGGPNLNLLGKREPEVYGSDSLADIESFIEESFKDKGFSMQWHQSNSESDLIDLIHGAEEKGFEAIIINPAGLTHTSVSLHDALKAFQGKKIEVHLSNTYKREEFRKVKITSGASDGVIEGFGKNSYALAFTYLLQLS
ncbi:MAG: type II 3-dehydroquinate dehydratase [Bdellovibrionota bacterium]|nr:type II 3-dehydroquinate dehydratase [Bdellovibrionota bacterium]